jgi:hypothetical protein
MPVFIDRDGDPPSPAPFQFADVCLRSFVARGDLDALTRICDAQLNLVPAEDCGFHFAPLGRWVFISVLTYPRMVTLDPKYADRGYTTQHELIVFFPVVRSVMSLIASQASLLVPEEVSMFFPYVIVDNPWSMITGREVIGFLKLLGDFSPEPPEQPVVPFELTVRSDVLSPYTTNTQMAREPIAIFTNDDSKLDAAYGAVDVVQNPIDTLVELSWPWAQLTEDMLDSANPAYIALCTRQLASGLQGFSTVQLKQFRSHANSTDACYQALIRGEFTVSNVREGAVLPATVISLPPYDSIGIAKTLGLPAVQFRAPGGLQTTVDMEYGNCSVLWEGG